MYRLQKGLRVVTKVTFKVTGYKKGYKVSASELIYIVKEVFRNTIKMILTMKVEFIDTIK